MGFSQNQLFTVDDISHLLFLTSLTDRWDGKSPQHSASICLLLQIPETTVLYIYIYINIDTDMDIRMRNLEMVNAYCRVPGRVIAD